MIPETVERRFEPVTFNVDFAFHFSTLDNHQSCTGRIARQGNPHQQQIYILRLDQEHARDQWCHFRITVILIMRIEEFEQICMFLGTDTERNSKNANTSNIPSIHIRTQTHTVIR